MSSYCFKHITWVVMEDGQGWGADSNRRGRSFLCCLQGLQLLSLSLFLSPSSFSVLISFFSLFCFTIRASGFRSERLQMARVLEQWSRGTGGPESCHMSHESSFQSCSYLLGRMSSSSVRGASALSGAERCQNTINKTVRFLQRSPPGLRPALRCAAGWLPPPASVLGASEAHSAGLRDRLRAQMPLLRQDALRASDLLNRSRQTQLLLGVGGSGGLGPERKDLPSGILIPESTRWEGKSIAQGREGGCRRNLAASLKATQPSLDTFIPVNVRSTWPRNNKKPTKPSHHGLPGLVHICVSRPPGRLASL